VKCYGCHRDVARKDALPVVIRSDGRGAWFCAGKRSCAQTYLKGQARLNLIKDERALTADTHFTPVCCPPGTQKPIHERVTLKGKTSKQYELCHEHYQKFQAIQAKSNGEIRFAEWLQSLQESYKAKSDTVETACCPGKTARREACQPVDIRGTLRTTRIYLHPECFAEFRKLNLGDNQFTHWLDWYKKVPQNQKPDVL
jgi:hypothetical protein